MKQVKVRNELTNEVVIRTFPTEQVAKGYIIGAVYGQIAALNCEISVEELQNQIRNRNGLRLGFTTWTII